MTHGRWLSRQSCLAALVALHGAAASAAVVNTFNTGVDASGTPLPPGAVDAHWQVVSGPGGGVPTQAVVVSNQHPVGQYYAVPDAQWIWANAAGSAVVGAPYTFELAIDLTGFNPATASLSGSWGADNAGSVLFNGAAPVGTGVYSLTGLNLANFNTGHGFTITGGFVSGVNRLDFTVVDGGNPGGLSVYGLSAVAAAVPEISTALSLLAGLLLIGGASRRRNTAR